MRWPQPPTTEIDLDTHAWILTRLQKLEHNTQLCGLPDTSLQLRTIQSLPGRRKDILKTCAEIRHFGGQHDGNQPKHRPDGNTPRLKHHRDTAQKGNPLSDTGTDKDAAASEDFTAASEPFDLFASWLDAASRSEINDPNAMALATVDPDGLPNVRMVLLKGLDETGGPGRGFVFYTNYESAKGGELLSSQKAAIMFHWKSLRRQIRIRGPVSPVSAEEADAYFNSRPRGSRIGAWASSQSRPMEGRFDLEKNVAAFTAKFGIGHIPRPPHWSGFRITPVQIEFWHDRPFRLHDRIVFSRASTAEDWIKTRLYP